MDSNKLSTWVICKYCSRAFQGRAGFGKLRIHQESHKKQLNHNDNNISMTSDDGQTNKTIQLKPLSIFLNRLSQKKNEKKEILGLDSKLKRAKTKAKGHRQGSQIKKKQAKPRKNADAAVVDVANLLEQRFRKTRGIPQKYLEDEDYESNGDTEFILNFETDDDEDEDFDIKISKTKLKSPKIAKHSEKLTFECQWCNKIFATKPSKDRHEARRHDPVTHALLKRIKRKNIPKPFTCEKCGGNFASGWSHKKHESTCSGQRKNISTVSGIFEPEICLAEEITDRIEDEDPLSMSCVGQGPIVKSEYPLIGGKEKWTSSNPKIIHVNLSDIVGKPDEPSSPVTELSQGCDESIKTEEEGQGQSSKEPPYVIRLSNSVVSLKNEIPPEMDVSDIFVNCSTPTPTVYEILKEEVEGDEEQLVTLTFNAFPSTSAAIEIRQGPISESEVASPREAVVSNSQGKRGRPSRKTEAFRTTATKRKTEKPEGGKNFKCHLCEKTFQLNKNLKLHLKRHVAQRTIPCDFPLCNKKFKNQTNLVSHMKTHSIESPYKCHVCGKSYRQAHGLRAHSSVHTGVMPYPCPECPLKFSSFTSRKAHVIRNHTKIKSFVCTFCAKAFLFKHQLICHERYHTGERPLKCSFCNKGFARPNTRRKHELKHMRETGDFYGENHSVHSLIHPPTAN